MLVTVVENEAHSMTTPGHMAKPKSDLTAASSFLPRLREACVWCFAAIRKLESWIKLNKQKDSIKVKDQI